MYKCPSLIIKIILHVIINLNNKFFESRPYSTVNIVNIIECVSYALCGRANHIPGFYPVILPVLVEDLQFPYTVV